MVTSFACTAFYAYILARVSTKKARTITGFFLCKLVVLYCCFWHKFFKYKLYKPDCKLRPIEFAAANDDS